MSIIIEIEDESLEVRNKRDGGTYSIQCGFAHVVDRSGKRERYPRKINVFPPKDPQGNPVPYKVGKYQISPTSFKVDNRDFLEMGYLNLMPVGGKS